MKPKVLKDKKYFDGYTDLQNKCIEPLIKLAKYRQGETNESTNDKLEQFSFATRFDKIKIEVQITYLP